MYHEFATDPIVQSLAFEDQRHFIVLLCLKCNGVLDRPLKGANRDRIIYRSLGLDPHAAEEAKTRLLEVGIINKKWQPKAWNKRQYISDDATQRTRKHRKTKETRNDIETAARRSGNAPDTDTDTDKDLYGHFVQFWKSYPRKKNKGSAERAWRKLKPDLFLLQAILDGLERAKNSKDWTKDNGDYIPHPATWLNARGWEDEPENNDNPSFGGMI